ncbi:MULTISPECIES: hypothetical protein [unclassified Pannonibacter]|uniref:hypothetical protein n=1 Tax=unclassified Pannonibacter TaxID=2627228 RepID=UPI0016468732|nr:MULTISPECIES: hypothetical protein [unclassified Pannonibacter]
MDCFRYQYTSRIETGTGLAGPVNIFNVEVLELPPYALLLFVKRRKCNFLNIVLAALLIDACDPLLEIDAGLDGAQDFVAGAENALEKPELLGKKLVDSLIRLVLAIDEIDDDHVVFREWWQELVQLQSRRQPFIEFIRLQET